jgi:transcriptional regulator with XRE-family HTH domain
VYSVRIVDTSALTERLIAAAGDRTYRSLADLTGTNAETVRRYMQGQAPSVEFLAALCAALGINEQWLISGRGPMRANQLKTHVLKDASPSELLSAMAGTIERIAERVDRLELFITSMETRLRGRLAEPPALAPASAAVSPANPSSSFADHPDGSGHSAPTPAQTARRARLVADAVAQRPRENAR